MKVLVMAPDQIKLRAGGLRTQVERTIYELRGLGVEVTEYNHWVDTDFSKYDIAHIFSMNTPNFFKAQSIRGKIPTVFSSVMWRNGSIKKIRALVELGIRSPYMILNDVISCRKMSDWADSILPNTNQESEWLSKAIGVDKRKCYVVPNGADDNFSAYSYEELGKRSSISMESDFMLCVSVISQRKNLLRLAKISLKYEIPLVIAGPVVDLEIKNKIDEFIKSGAKITFTGPLNNQSFEMGYLYSRCRVFCLPSFYETPGIAALEAGLMGARVVITKIGGAEDYFENMATYIDPYSQKDMEEKILEAWELGRDPVLGANLSSHIKENFSWRSVAQKTVAQYKRVLGNEC